jgi:hypothetical protein
MEVKIATSCDWYPAPLPFVAPAFVSCFTHDFHFRDAQTSDLNAHFKKCNQTLDELPGTDLTHAQQQALLRQYQDQLKRKRCRVCASRVRACGECVFVD